MQKMSAVVRKLLVSSVAALMGAALLATEATAQQHRSGRAAKTATSVSPDSNGGAVGNGTGAWDNRAGYAQSGSAHSNNEVFMGNTYLGTDPDPFIRSELRRDWGPY
jgi:hypothetical protein